MGFWNRKKSKNAPDRKKMNAARWPTKIVGKLGYETSIDGYPSMEFMHDLKPPHGLQKYRMMKMNDPIVGGLILQIENIMRQLSIHASGPNADYIMDMLNALPGGMQALHLNMASAFTYGFFIGEKIYKYENGEYKLIDIAPRFAPSIERINTSDGFVVQQCAKGTFYIPYKKCVHHMIMNECREPFGISMLRHLYKPYYYKISVEASEASGIDRNLTGFPILQAPENFSFENTDPESPDYDPLTAATLEWALDLVNKIRTDTISGAVLPHGWELDIISGAKNNTDIDISDTISRYNTEMAAGVLENFMALGAFATTNNANTDVNVETFLSSCDAYSKGFAQTYNEQIVKQICELNDLEAPTLYFSPIKEEALTDLASFFTRLVNAGVITPTTTLEKELLELAEFTYDPTTIKTLDES